MRTIHSYSVWECPSNKPDVTRRYTTVLLVLCHHASSRIDTTTRHSAVLTIYNDSYCDSIYATNTTQTPHLTKNKTKNIKNGRLNMLLKFQRWMQNLERLLLQQVARWCVEVLVVKKGNQKSEVVDEVPISFYCQPPPTTRKIPNIVASDYALCGYLHAWYNDSSIVLSSLK